MTVRAPLVSGAIGLVSLEEPGLDPDRIATDTSTTIAAGAVDVRGQSVLVDVKDRGGTSAAMFVRALLPPHQVDVDRFEAVLAAFRRSGVADLVTEPVDAVLRTAFEARRHFWDPREFLTQAFLDRALERDEVFPTMWWHDDPSAGVDEMAGLLKLLGVGKRFPRKRLIADARRALDRTDDEDAAREELCLRLCEVANDLLRDVKPGRQFCGPYFSDFNGGEPNWLFTTSQQFESLISEQLLIRWDPKLRVPMEPSSYKRPPDLGEIDFSRFPTGDDPF